APFRATDGRTLCMMQGPRIELTGHQAPPRGACNVSAVPARAHRGHVAGEPYRPDLAQGDRPAVDLSARGGEPFAAAVEEWLTVQGHLREAVRHEVLAAQLREVIAARGETPLRVLDVGCGQGTQALM